MAENVRFQVLDTLKKLKGSEDLLANPRPLLNLIAEKLYWRARQSFETESSPEGVPWQRLSARYGAWKSKRFPGRGILRLRGQLIRSLKRGVEGNEIAFVSEGPLLHAAVHQYGFDGIVTVPEHVRRIKSRNVYRSVGAWTTKGEETKYTKKRVLAAAGITRVKSYKRHMVMPARPSMGFPPVDQEDVRRDVAELITAPFKS